eukprot:g5819.t1
MDENGNETNAIRLTPAEELAQLCRSNQEPSTADMEAIVALVDSYFTDENLPKDLFMLKQLRKNKENKVAIKVIASFRGVKKLVRDQTLLIEALRKSENIIVSDDGKFLQRRQPIPPEWFDWIDSETKKRRCTCKVEGNDEASVKERLREYGTIVNVTLNEAGFILVEFSSEKEAVQCVRACRAKVRSEEASSWRRAEKAEMKIYWCGKGKEEPLPKEHLPKEPLKEHLKEHLKEPLKEHLKEHLNQSPNTFLPKTGKVKKSDNEEEVSKLQKGSWVFDTKKGTYVANNDTAKAEMLKIEQESKEMGWGSRFKTRRPRLNLKKKKKEESADDFAFMTYAKGPDESRIRHPDGSPGFSLKRNVGGGEEEEK